MVTPETLAAALRVAQHGARSAMLAARANTPPTTDTSPVQQQQGRPTPAPTRAQAQPQAETA